MSERHDRFINLAERHLGERDKSVGAPYDRTMVGIGYALLAIATQGEPDEEPEEPRPDWGDGLAQPPVDIPHDRTSEVREAAMAQVRLEPPANADAVWPDEDRAAFVTSIRNAVYEDKGVRETRPLIQPTPVKGPAS